MFKTNKWDQINLLLTLNNKNTILNNKNIFTHSTHNLLNQQNTYFIDLFCLESTQTLSNKVTYVFYNKNTLKQYSFNIININYLVSNSDNINILDWYERELNENTNIIIKNIKDIRNLILPYSYKFLRNNFYKKQNYKWVFTDISKKQINVNNKLKIIL